MPDCKKCAANQSKAAEEKRRYSATRRERKVVSCIDCNGPLQGLNGWSYPVHLVPVTVSVEQLNAWQAEGHNFDVV